MKVKGIPVGTTMPRSDWNQTDPSKADYIRNKPSPVCYTEQSLTEEQKAQARANIGLAIDNKSKYAVTSAGWVRIAKLAQNSTMPVFKIATSNSVLLMASEGYKYVHILEANDKAGLFAKARIFEENGQYFLEVYFNAIPKGEVNIAVIGEVAELYEVFTEGQATAPTTPTADRLSGTWVFSEKIANASGDASANVQFTANGNSYSKIDAWTIDPEEGLTYDMYYDKLNVYWADTAYQGKWKDEAYRTVDFGTEGQVVDQTFYDWLVANATYQGGASSTDLLDGEFPIYHNYPMINRPLIIDGTKIAKDCFDDVMVASGDGILQHYEGEEGADSKGWYRIAKMSTKTVATFHFNTSNSVIQCKGIFTVVGSRVSPRTVGGYSTEPVITQLSFRRDITNYTAPEVSGVSKIRLVYGCTDENPVRPEEAEVMYLEVYREATGGKALYIKAVGSTIEVPGADYEVPAIEFYAHDTLYPASDEVPAEVSAGAKVKEFVFKENALVADAIYVGDNKVLDTSNVDTELDKTSTNLVQNKAIAEGVETAGKSVLQIKSSSGRDKYRSVLLATDLSADEKDNPVDRTQNFVYKAPGIAACPYSGELFAKGFVAENDVIAGTHKLSDKQNKLAWVSQTQVDKMIKGEFPALDGLFDATNGAVLNYLVQELKDYIDEKYAPKSNAISRKDSDKDRNLNTQHYEADLQAKLFIVNVGIDGYVDAAYPVCIDFWQIQKGDADNALNILLPFEDGDGEQAILYAWRTNSGVPIFETQGKIRIKGVTSYI